MGQSTPVSTTKVLNSRQRESAAASMQPRQPRIVPRANSILKCAVYSAAFLFVVITFYLRSFALEFKTSQSPDERRMEARGSLGSSSGYGQGKDQFPARFAAEAWRVGANPQCWPITWPRAQWFDWLSGRFHPAGEGFSFILVGANLGCPSTASVHPAYIPNYKECGDPIYTYAMQHPGEHQRGVLVEPVPLEMAVVTRGWNMTVNKTVSFFNGVATADCSTAIRNMNRPPEGTCCSEQNKHVSFSAPSARARLERPKKGAQWINQIGSLVGEKTIKGVLKNVTDVDILTVPCTTVPFLAANMGPDMENSLDILYVDVEGFEFWVLAELFKTASTMHLRPRVIVFENKIIDHVSPGANKDLLKLLSEAGYYVGLQDGDNTRAVRLDVLADILTIQQTTRGSQGCLGDKVPFYLD